MSKNYQPVEAETTMVSEPTHTYNAHTSYRVPEKVLFEREHIMADTMSVDEYFDKLINLVQSDYANLCLSYRSNSCDC